MKQEEDKVYDYDTDLKEIEELISLLDPNSEVFLKSKVLIKDLKGNNNSDVNKDDTVLKR